MALSWRLDPTVLGMSVLSISPGISGLGGKPDVSTDDRNRALVETLALGLIASKLTKSFWPVTAPVIYLAFNKLWSDMHNVPSQVG